MRRSVIALAFFALNASVAYATEEWFPIDRNPWFPDWRRQVQELVDQSPLTKSSRICVVGWTDGALSSLQAFVIWPSGRRLITWIPSKTDPHSLIHQTHVLNLDTDVVASERDIAGSTYLVTKTWLRGIERQCRIQGTTLTVTPDRSPDHGVR